MENNDKAEQIQRHLPEDIVTEILSRLPVQSLLRFKSVCKPWRFLISSKHFIKTHLQISDKNETFTHHRFILTSLSFSKCPGNLRVCSLRSLLTEPATRSSPLDFFPASGSTNLRIVGSCNGLTCVLIDSYRFFLLNPTTREYRQLPDFERPNEFGFMTGLGFGFVESSGDYKVNAVFRRVLFPSTSDVARVYSLKADSWRGNNVPFKDGWNCCRLGKFVSGKLHWRSYKSEHLESEWEIVCLDLESERFGTLEKLPRCFEGYFCPILLVVKGCLCALFGYPKAIRFDIWIWSEYGVEDSWANFFTIPNPCHALTHSIPWRGYLTPPFVLSNGEVLYSCGSGFFIYNPKDDRLSQCHTIDDDRYDAIVYTESLVSLVN
ncbi:hypothetical protein ABFX02_13G055400 [Erythranthe guttata]